MMEVKLNTGILAYAAMQCSDMHRVDNSQPPHSIAQLSEQ